LKAEIDALENELAEEGKSGTVSESFTAPGR